MDTVGLKINFERTLVELQKLRRQVRSTTKSIYFTSYDIEDIWLGGQRQ
jgi:hypothetical protein